MVDAVRAHLGSNSATALLGLVIGRSLLYRQIFHHSAIGPQPMDPRVRRSESPFLWLYNDAYSLKI